MRESEVYAEIARRKVQFHANEEWQSIWLWGLFQWGEVSHMIKSGKLITNMKKENKTIWVRPSQEIYEKHIKPLIENYTLDELIQMAGWNIN